MAASAYATPIAATLTTSTTSSAAGASLTPVQLLPEPVQGPNTQSLAHAPSNLTSGTRAFLDAYQPYSTVADAFTGSKKGDRFSSTGHCYSEYPCFSVNHGAVASVGSQPEVSADQMSALLDSVLAMQYVTFDHSHPDMALSGFKTSQQGATLEVIAPNGILPSSILAGMAFDMFKLQSNNARMNAIRAVQAPSDGQPQPTMALYVYPDLGSSTADIKAVQNFCVGKELDGTITPANPQLSKRFSIDGLLGGFCAFIDVPLICPSSSG